MNQVEVSRTLPLSREKLYPYFIRSALVQQWANPEGMTLSVPYMDAKLGGRYRYEHTSKDGTYAAEGHFEELSPSRIVQLDEWIKGPDGQLMSEKIRNVITLDDRGDTTDVKVTASGFGDQKMADDCRSGWAQCFDHLEVLLVRASNLGKITPRKNARSRPPAPSEQPPSEQAS